MPIDSLSLLAISVGNTRTRFGVFNGRELREAESIENRDQPALIERLRVAAAEAAGAPAVIASVNDPVADAIERAFDAASEGGKVEVGGVYRLGSDLAIPIAQALRDPITVGQDRLLNALGAYSRARQACIVIDAGTAVTVDFVDGEGVFQGGAIAPGLNMMLRALHEGTAALPSLRFEGGGAAGLPIERPFGQDTREAMLLGVRSAVRGLVHELIDRYAEFYGAYPQVVATGGDARSLFEDDPLIEHLIPDLTLIGIQIACETTLRDEEDGGGGDHGAPGASPPPSRLQSGDDEGAADPDE